MIKLEAGSTEFCWFQTDNGNYPPEIIRLATCLARTSRFDPVSGKVEFLCGGGKDVCPFRKIVIDNCFHTSDKDWNWSKI